MTSLTTCTTGISVFEPGAPDIFILLIHAEVHVGDPLSEANGGDDSRNARSNDNDSQGTGFVDGTLFHRPLILDRSCLLALGTATKEETSHIDCICESGEEEQRELIQKGMRRGTTKLRCTMMRARYPNSLLGVQGKAVTMQTI
jgi:hypothetical protein